MSIIDVLNVRDLRAKAIGFSFVTIFGKRKEKVVGFRSLLLLIPVLMLVLAAPATSYAGTAPPDSDTIVYPPPDVTAEASGPFTWVDLGVATAGCGGGISSLIPIDKNPKPPYSVGVHTITWTGTPIDCNAGTATQTVTIEDTTPPFVQPPADLTLTYSEAQGAPNLGTATATDLVDGSVAASTSSTSPFPVGNNSVVWTAKDSEGNTGTAIQTVLVVADSGSGSGGGVGVPNITTSPIGSTQGKFSVSPSGAATYEIPIAIAPGVKGMQPNLALAYNSQRGNGLLGMGWALKGLSAISRCGTNIATDGIKGGVYLDDRDKFCLDGQRLINIGGNEYRTQTESWRKIIAAGGTASDPSHFIVYTKSGKVLEYGNSQDSRIESSGNTVARLWLLNSTSDESGNYYSIEYDEDNSIGDHRPTRIEYGSSAAAVGSVYFSYSSRDDAITRYQAGSEFTTTKILTGITALNGSYLFREISLNYDTATRTNRPQLKSVQECGSDGVCYAPTTFNWLDSQTGFNSETWTGYGGWTNQNLTGDFSDDGKTDVVTLYDDSTNGEDPKTEVRMRVSTESDFKDEFYILPSGFNRIFTRTGDFDGNGSTDISGLMFFCFSSYGDECTGTLRAALSSKNGFVNQGTSTKYNEWGDHRFIRTGDFNGDGRSDIGSADGSVVWVRLSTGGKFTNETWPVTNTWGGSDYTWVGDFNGDGLSDFASAVGGNVYMKLSTGSGFISETWPVDNIWGTGAFSWAADINGDGLTDIISRLDDNVFVKLSTGKGFVSEQWAAGSDWGTADFTRIADFNGDGLSDIASASGTDVFLKLSTGNGFVEETWPVEAGWGKDYLTWVGDVDGDGNADLISAYNGTFYIKRNKLGTVDKLQSITNGLGSTISVDYKKLNDPAVYTAGSGAGYPEQDIRAPISVVASYSADNGIGSTSSTRYEYSGLKFHKTGSANLGFASVKSIDEQTGAVSTTLYDQDFDSRRIGSPNLSTTVVGGCEVSRSSVLWQGFVNTNGTPETYDDTFEVYKESETAISRELNTCQVFKSVTTTFGDYEYGSAKYVSVDYGDGYSQTTTSNFVVADEDSWTIAQLESSSVTATSPINPPLTRTSRFEYDALGRLTKEVIQPSNLPPGDPQFELTTSYTHDDFGNRISTTVSGAGIVSRTSSATFDAQGRFPITATNVLDHSETRTYHSITGQVEKLTGPNGLDTVWGYDGFGRKVYEGRADGTTTEISYALSSGATCPSLGSYYMRTDTTGAPSVYECFDGLNRNIRNAKVSFNGTWVFEDTEYNNLGQVARKSRPYFDGGTAYYADLAYDLLGRVTSLTEPGKSPSTSIYDGLKITSTNPKGQTITKVNSSQGKLETVTDAASQIQTYEYDAFGNLTKVTDPIGNISSMTYDIRGRKIAMNDPDMGSWSYEYNVLGELTKQTDAKLQVTTNTYDVLGRLKTRTIPEGTSTWTYDTATKGKGKLASVTGFDSTSQSLSYDSLGRLSSVTKNISATGLTVSYGYDTSSRVKTVTYPGGFTKTNEYKSTGYLWQVLGGADNLLYWQKNNTTAEGQTTDETFSGFIGSTREYYAETGYLKNIKSQGLLGQLQDLTYTFDHLGNLKSRVDATHGYTETFDYDNLNQLKTVTGPSSKSFSYDTIGNITFKSDVGSYLYGENGAGPHAVTSVSGTLNASYNYDANGNMKLGGGRDITYTSFNKPSVVGMGGNASAFYYDADYNRVRKELAFDNYTLYFDKLYEQRKIGVVTTHKFYMFAGKQLVAIHEQDGINPNKDLFVLTDHLGSTETIVKDSGEIVQQFSFDAHGKRRNLDGTDMANPPAYLSSRGFTGHEMDDEIGLINMNARMYDPVLGRFLSADTIIPDAELIQAYNRYTYVYNNPLSLTDPSGHNPLLALLGWLAGIEVEAIVFKGITDAFWADLISTMAGGATTAFVASGGDLEAAWQGAFTAGVIGFASEYIPTGTYGDMFGSGINGYYQSGGDPEGFWRGYFAGLLPEDLWVGESYKDNRAVNIGIGIARDGAKGFIVGGQDGILEGIKIGQFNNAVGHLIGFATTGRAPKIKNGVFVYESKWWKAGNALTSGNVVSGWSGMSTNQRYSALYEHELGHIPQSKALGALYLPANIISLSVAQLEGMVQNFDFGNYHHSTTNLMENLFHSYPSEWMWPNYNSNYKNYWMR